MTTTTAVQTLTMAEAAGLSVCLVGDALTVSGRRTPKPLGLLHDLKAHKAAIVALLRERQRARDYGRLGNTPTVVLPADMCVACLTRPVRSPDDVTPQPRLCASCNVRIMTRARWPGTPLPAKDTDTDRKAA